MLYEYYIMVLQRGEEWTLLDSPLKFTQYIVLEVEEVATLMYVRTSTSEQQEKVTS